jgi:hypothetical protein
MDENKQDHSHSTQYIKSNNRGNTIDNTQRTTKEEDPLNPSYTNPPLGKKEQRDVADASERNECNE